MRYILAFVISLVTINCFATSFVWKDGRVFFAKYTVGGIPVLSDKERDAILSQEGYSGAQVTVITPPTNYETLLSTSGLKFNSYSEFFDCAKSTIVIQDKIDDLKPSEARKVQVQAIKDAIK